MMRDDNATSINKRIKALDTESLVQGQLGWAGREEQTYGTRTFGVDT